MIDPARTTLPLVLTATAVAPKSDPSLAHSQHSRIGQQTESARSLIYHSNRAGVVDGDSRMEMLSEVEMGLTPLAVPVEPNSVTEPPRKLAIHAFPVESLAMATGPEMPPFVKPGPESTVPVLESSTTLLAPVLAIQMFPVRSMEMPRGATSPALPKLVVEKLVERLGSFTTDLPPSFVTQALPFASIATP